MENGEYHHESHISPKLGLTDLGTSAFKTVVNEKPKRIWRAPRKLLNRLPSPSELRQYVAVLLCGFTIWGSVWFMFEGAGEPYSPLFHMAMVVILGYVMGHTLERLTTLHPVVGMTLVGALYRNLVPGNFLEDTTVSNLDFHLRRIYPVVILTRGPLSWSWEYIRGNPVRVLSLATLPWLVECMSIAVLTHMLLQFTWYWGLHLGAILSSVSPAVVVPTLIALSAQGLDTRSQVALLVGNAGGLDTAFTEGMFGIINSAIFYPAVVPYRIAKGVLAMVVGIVAGVAWGVLVDYLPDHDDVYAPTVRSMLIFFGGLLLSYTGAHFGWGGVSGVAIMVCAATAATRWARRGWLVNNNPVSEVYKLLWRVLEPMLFSLSGYYLEISSISTQDLYTIVGVIIAALFLRLVTAMLVCVANDLTVRESLLVTAAWIPKAIVEAVLVRVATDSLNLEQNATDHDAHIAKLHSNIIVIAILITSTLGSALTTALGPVLLTKESRVAPHDVFSPPVSTISGSSQLFNSYRTVKTHI